MNTTLKIHTTKSIGNFEKRHIYFNYLTTISDRIHSISINNKRGPLLNNSALFSSHLRDSRSRQSQEQIWLQLAASHSLQHRCVENTMFLRVCWEMFCHSCCRKRVGRFTSTGGGCFSAIRRPRPSQTCSVGAKSGEQADKSVLGIPAAAGSL